jgi:hypothetical protein
MRKSSKLIVVAGALAALAVPSVASANVAVDDQGVGFVGKGDVQNALGLANDQAIQHVFKSGGIKFTTERTWSVDYTQTCAKVAIVNGAVKYVPTGTTHTVISAPVTQEAKSTANTNGAGKLSNGWTFTGFDGAETTGASTTTQQPVCPAGSFVYSTDSQDSGYGPRGGLKVNGIDLPNTPVEVTEPVV